MPAAPVDRLPDHGPRYAETPADPYAPGSPVPAEPWNAVTATLFVAIALYWAVKLFGRYRRYAFLSACIPILLTGGVGGTLYHATRTHTLYFLLDLIPILLLGLATSVMVAFRLGRHTSRRNMLLGALGLLSVYVLINGVMLAVPSDIKNLRVNVSYATLALVIVTPLVVLLVRTKFRYWALVAAAVMIFALAWLCRLVDGPGRTDLPMGTHWLWHLFGAITTQLLTVYLYRVSRDDLP